MSAMRIRSQLIVIAVAVLLPVLLATGMAIEKIREGAREAALRGLHETVRATVLTVDRDVQSSLSALKVLGNSENLETRNFEDFYRKAAALNQLPDVWTLLLDSTGTQVLNTAVPFDTPLPPPLRAAQERVSEVLSTQQPSITNLYVGPIAGELLTTFYVPAAAAGGRSFVVAQAFSVDHWKRTAFQRSLPPSWIVAVIDRNGKFIFRSHKTDELLGQSARPELVAAAAASSEGLIRHQTLEDIESYDAFAHSSLTGWTIAVAAPVAMVEAAAADAVYWSLLGIVLALSVAITVIVFFAQRFVSAIDSARTAAVALGRGEKPEPRQGAVAEINELNDALIDAGALLASERNFRQAAESERERLLENETRAREAAQAQNVAKDQFLAMLGHEIRNPMAAISGATALLETGALDQAGSERYLGIIRRQNGHLGRIVDDLLDVSRLVAGKIVLERRPLDLADCITGCVDALRATDGAAGHIIEIDSSSVWVDGDASRIEQIVNNLITNALKFSPPRSKVQVKVGIEGGRAVVKISDRGAGMTPELLQRIFEPFVQGPAPANGAQSGLGIGLALVRQLVKLHEGEVEVTSPGPGHGSIFCFYLPIVAARHAEPVRRGLVPLAGRTIVLVEDNADARATMGDLLRVFGYRIIEVANGTGVLPTVLAAQPDLVITDIGLPDIDGYEVARRLRADPATRTVPLIALTGFGQLGDREAAERAGFDAHLVKPVSPEELVETIERLVKR